MTLRRLAEEDLIDERPTHRRRTIKLEDDDNLSSREARLPESAEFEIQTSELELHHQVKLCDEQRELLRSVHDGKNVWITGAAGTGKSTVLKMAISMLRAQGLRVRATAPTGIAALQLGGTTTWVFAGWTPHSKKLTLDEIKKSVRDHDYYTSAGTRIRDTDVLVIDEISMVENDFLQRLSLIIAQTKRNTLPFGGMQVIVTGDFCQLPPVKPFAHCVQCGKDMRRGRAQGTYRCPDHGEREDKDKWAFRAPAWNEADFFCINLKENHRQNDPYFLRILERIRFGERLSGSQHNKLRTGGHTLVDPVKLFARVNDAREENETRLDQLSGRLREYVCVDNFKLNPKHDHLQFKGLAYTKGEKIALDHHRYEANLHLKTGAQVVLLTNLDVDGGLVNGSQGRILRFEPHDYTAFPRASFRDGISSQGIDDTRERIAFEPASVVSGGDYSSYKHEQQRSFVQHQPSENVRWPVVHFNNGRTVMILPHCSVEELGDERPHSILSRTQVPLSLAYGLTIHKSQGMTLSAVEVDLARVWEAGQAYVALSRARSLEGLKVTGLNQGISVLSMDPQVQEFYTEKFPELRAILNGD